MVVLGKGIEIVRAFYKTLVIGLLIALGSANAATAASNNRDSIAVVIGNRDYSEGIPRVAYAQNDARAMRRFLRDVMGYREGNIIYLENASQAQMVSTFGSSSSHEGKLWAWIKPGRSDVFVYYSGHGLPGQRDKRGYLMPVDADPNTVELNGYSLDTLLSNLRKLDARSTTVILEACFSGNSAGGWLVESASPAYIPAAAPTMPHGITLITAAQGDQLASWDERNRHGLFTYHLLQALYGQADRGYAGNQDGMVSLGEVESYLSDEMSYAARRNFARVQEASIAGDPKQILLASLPTSPAPRIKPQPEPQKRVTTFRIAPRKKTIKYAVHGNFNVPDGTKRSAQNFLESYRSKVEEAIHIYYASQGVAWDPEGWNHNSNNQVSDGLRSISQLIISSASRNEINMSMDYVWHENINDYESSIKLSLEITPDWIRVKKFWR